MHKPKLLILSHVLPFPQTAGQRQRVFYTLQAARELFHITFVTPVAARHAQKVSAQLSAVCDEPVVLPSRYTGNPISTNWHRCASSLYALYTGLNRSNYEVGRVEFHPSRIGPLLRSGLFDCALFEYWHASPSIPVFRSKGIPCILDMHDILWQARSQRLGEEAHVPAWWRQRAIDRYRAAEEGAWKQFSGLIAINREEQEYVRAQMPRTVPVFYAPMGTDLSRWPYSWEPARPMRVAYYGGLGSRHNQEAAMRCLHQIMPQIWQRFPEAELWLVGSNPPASLRALAADPRVHVTGYVETVQDILRSMSVVICPWSGTYGFRSRLIEVMALGVPVVASSDAVYGMELQEGKGLWLGHHDDDLAAHSLHLLGDVGFAHEQSRLARLQVEKMFSIENTYRRLMSELDDWLRTRTEAAR